MTRQSPIGILQRLRDAIFLPLCELNRIQFSAPWSAPRPTC